jgi:phage baseplate assembly protein W
MPQYIGFSTINANKPRSTNLNSGVDGGTGSLVKPIVVGKKFRLVDSPLVIQDFVNALNIPQGQKVGQPQYGTTLWDFIFEPNTYDLQTMLETEIRRVAGLDPRINLNYVKAYPQENGILVEIQMAVVPFNNVIDLGVFFDQTSNTASLQ